MPMKSGPRRRWRDGQARSGPKRGVHAGHDVSPWMRGADNRSSSCAITIYRDSAYLPRVCAPRHNLGEGQSSCQRGDVVRGGVSRAAHVHQVRSAARRPPRPARAPGRRRPTATRWRAARTPRRARGSRGSTRSTPTGGSPGAGLVVAQHPVAAVVDDQDRDRQALLHQRRQLADAHQQPAVAADREHGWPGGRGPDRGGQRRSRACPSRPGRRAGAAPGALA